MWRLLHLFVALVLVGCAAQPPERSPLPDVEDVVRAPTGCQLSVGSPIGVDVVSVIDSSAASGILLEGDVITGVDDVPTVTRKDLTDAMIDHAPGDRIEVTYTRDGSEETAAITLGENPDDTTRPMIGITIETAFETISPDEADGAVHPSATARPIQIGDRLFLFDPLTNVWEPTGLTAPTATRWVATSGGLYAVTDTDPVDILDLITGEPVTDDGFRDWEPLRLVGAVNDVLLLVLSADVPSQPGFVNLAIGGFDPVRGRTTWIAPVSNTFGIPVAAFGSPDDSAFLLVGADPESTEQTGATLYSAAGRQVVTEDLTPLGSPMGWFDQQSMAFRSSEEEVIVYNLTDAAQESHSLGTGIGVLATTVGDGENILAVSGRDMFLQSLLDPTISSPLASNCTIGRAGEPGWGT